MLLLCWHMQAFRRLPEADPQLILAPGSQTGLLSGPSQAWERGLLQAKKCWNYVGMWFFEAPGKKLVHVGCMLA